MTTWQPTRRDLKKFLADVKAHPGKRYYSVRECVQPWGNEPKYREIQFKASRLWVGTYGHHSAEATLSLYGPLTDVKPAKMRGLFDKGGPERRPDPRKVAADEHASRPKKPAKTGGWW